MFIGIEFLFLNNPNWFTNKLLHDCLEINHQDTAFMLSDEDASIVSGAITILILAHINTIIKPKQTSRVCHLLIHDND